MEQTDSNRREHQRFDTDFTIHFSSDNLEFSGTAEYRSGKAKNLSRGGLFIRSDYLDLPGTKIKLQIPVPNTKEKLHLEAEVSWIDDAPPLGPGMGIELIGQLLQEQL